MAKGKMKANLQVLLEERSRLVSEMEAIKNKIAGLELAMSLINKGDAVVCAETVGARQNLKQVIFDLLKEAGPTGINATTAVELASRKGQKLNRGSIASNLSRMAKERVVVYDGDRYRLPEFAKQPAIVMAGGKSVFE